MIGREKLIKILQSVIDRSRADHTEAVFFGGRSDITRYANSAIHQNVSETSPQITIRSLVGKQVGTATTSSIRAEHLKRTLENSYDVAQFLPENPDVPSLAKPTVYRDIASFDSTTARCRPAKRASMVKRMVDIAEGNKLTIAGALGTSAIEIAVVNSNGVEAYHPFSTAFLSVICMSENSSGYAARFSSRLDDINPSEAASTSSETCLLTQDPVELPPGDYEVILEPAAVAELLLWLNYTGFRSRAMMQNTSFMSGKIGKKITSEMITISDNAFRKGMVGLPFDFEGTPRRRVTLIKSGVALGRLHDRASAKLAGSRSTGHALPPFFAHFGAMGLHMCLSPGKSSREKMIQDVKRGVLVTRFHYVRGQSDVPDDTLTGMTRDGTFLIENGELTQGIKNLRFTDSVMRALSSCKAISRNLTLVKPEFAGMATLAPTLQLGSFRFTGKTDF